MPFKRYVHDKGVALLPPNFTYMRNIDFSERPPMEDFLLLNSKADDGGFRHPPPRDEEGRHSEENQGAV